MDKIEGATFLEHVRDDTKPASCVSSRFERSVSASNLRTTEMRALVHLHYGVCPMQGLLGFCGADVR
jgi:hypothetical protein